MYYEKHVEWIFFFFGRGGVKYFFKQEGFDCKGELNSVPQNTVIWYMKSLVLLK